MIEFVSTCDDPDQLRKIARNAAIKGAIQLQRAAKLRLFSILPQEAPGTLEYEVWQSIFALEDALSDERGKTIRLSRTRQKIGRQDERSCVADLVRGSESDGFRMLAERDMLELSFEAVALRFPELFDENVLQSARSRLENAGYDNS
ncbi:MAG: hypothetical protein ACR2FJ_03460 [Qipengyuania sp.]